MTPHPLWGGVASIVRQIWNRLVFLWHRWRDLETALQLVNWFRWPAKVISIIGGIIFLAFVFVWRMALPLIFVGLVVLIAALITATHYGLLLIYRWRRKISMRRVSGGRALTGQLAEVGALYNSWFVPAGDGAHRALQYLIGAASSHRDKKVQGYARVIQRYADDERAALSAVSNALKGTERTDWIDIQNRLGKYVHAYRACRDWISKGIAYTGVDASKHSVFERWWRADSDFLSVLKAAIGLPRYKTLRGHVEGVGWGENVTDELKKSIGPVAVSSAVFVTEPVTPTSSPKSRRPLKIAGIALIVILVAIGAWRYAKSDDIESVPRADTNTDHMPIASAGMTMIC